jgi:hypothetical protein
MIRPNLKCDQNPLAYNQEEKLLLLRNVFKTHQYTSQLAYDYIQIFKFSIRFSSGKET